MNPNIEFSIKTAQAYNAVCKPLCQELGLSQTALDILLFLANNPDYKTARDIVEVRHIKANLVSMNVDKLVQEGYLERREVPGDRRKTELICTEKTENVWRQGCEIRRTFIETLFSGISAESRKVFEQVMEQTEENLNTYQKENKKK